MYNYNFEVIIDKTNKLTHWLIEIKRRVYIKFKGKVFMCGVGKKKLREIPWQQFGLDFNFQKEDSHFSLEEEWDIRQIVFDVLSRLKRPKLKI